MRTNASEELETARAKVLDELEAQERQKRQQLAVDNALQARLESELVARRSCHTLFQKGHPHEEGHCGLSLEPLTVQHARAFYLTVRYLLSAEDNTVFNQEMALLKTLLEQTDEELRSGYVEAVDLAPQKVSDWYRQADNAAAAEVVRGLTGALGPSAIQSLFKASKQNRAVLSMEANDWMRVRCHSILLVNKTNGHNKFYLIEWMATHVVARYGKIGTVGGAIRVCDRNRDGKTLDQMRKIVLDKVSEKLDGGYTTVWSATLERSDLVSSHISTP